MKCNSSTLRDYLVLTIGAVSLWGSSSAFSAETTVLWQIGRPDHDNAEFALAPRDFSKYRQDGFFVVGRSDSRIDWPYVHPGPVDAWAGARPHIFSVLFGLKAGPTQGDCRLVLDLLDTHRVAPPKLRVEINGRQFDKDLPPGGGDESVNGQPVKGKAFRWEITFPASLLRTGDNQVSLSTLTGSWMLYDAVELRTPPGLELAPPTGLTLVDSIKPISALRAQDGKMLQGIRIFLRHFDQEQDAQVRLDGQTVSRWRLRQGPQDLELWVPAVAKVTQAKLELMVGGKTLASQPVALKPVRKWIFYLLPHSHVDIGYTELQTEIEKKQMRNIARGLEMAKATAHYPEGARYKWNVEVLWAVESYLRQQPSEKQQEFVAAVKNSQIGLQALYGNELTGLCRPEELVRLFTYAARLGDRCGVPIDSAMISDVPGYTWGIVSAMAQAGVKYWSVGPNYSDRIGLTLVEWENKPFYWTGPNGRDKILFWAPYMGYALSHITPPAQKPEMILNLLDKLEQKDYPYELIQLRWSGYGDNAVPDETIPDFVRDWNAKYAYPKLIIATASEAFRAFERRYGDKLPVYSGDFTPYWEDGAGSSARETALNRDAAERLVQTETLWALLHPAPFPAERFYQAWRNVILYDEHTWGAHNSISEPDKPFVKDQWKIKQAFALDAAAQSQKLLKEVLDQAAPGGAGENTVDVFNTTSWPRTDLVILPKSLARPGDVVTDEKNRPRPSQRLTGGELAFLAEAVPPFAARRYSLQAGQAPLRGQAKAAGATLENASLSLRIDEKTGGIVSLRHRSLGVELVDGQAEVALNDYLYLPGSDLKGLQRNGPVSISVKEKGPLVVSLIIESGAPGCRKLTREIRLVDGLDRVDLINTVDKQPVRAKEGVHFGFAFKVPGGIMRLDIPWAIMRPEIDQLPGACKNWFTVQRWVDISNQDYGVTWSPVDAPLVEVGGITANLIGGMRPQDWIRHLSPSQKLYSWVMNNHWHTNYRAEQEGPTVFRYSIRPHKKFRADEAEHFGMEASQPLIAAPAKGLVPGLSRLRLEPSSVIATAFKPSDDQRACIVRLFNASEKPVKARLTWSSPQPRGLWLSDVSEKPLQKTAGAVTMSGRGLVTLRAEFAE